MRKRHTKKELIVIVLGALALTCCFFGSSYALNNTTSPRAEYNYFGTSNLELSYVDHGMGNGDVLSLVNAHPKKDLEAISEDGYRFSITNISTNGYRYRIRIVEDAAMINEDDCMDRQLMPQYIKFQFDNLAPKSLIEIEATGYVLYESTEYILPGNSEIHELKIWLDSDTPQSIKDHYHGKVVLEEVEEKPYQEYSQGQEITIGDSSYLVLEDSDSKNAYLKLTPSSVNSFFKDECNQSNLCLFTSKDDLSGLFQGYRNGFRDQLQENIDLPLFHVRFFEKTEYLDYSLKIAKLNSEKRPFLIYNRVNGEIQMIHSSSGLDPNVEKNQIQLVIVLHKGLLEEEREEQ